MSTRHPITRRAFGQAGAATALAAALPQAFAATPKDTLVVAFAFDDIISLDPAEAFEISAGELMGNGYERLLRYDVNDPTKLLPDLAKSWKVSDDGKTYTFELKPGLKFASGNALTADDVAYSFHRAVLLDKTPAFILTQFGLTKEQVKARVKAAGPLTVTIETDKTYAPTLVYNCLTSNVASVVDSKLVQSKEKDGDFGAAWLKTGYAGSGPLKIREWRANEIVALERNEHFHGAKSKLARVIYRHVKESATQRLLLEKGDVDIARNLTPQDLDALAKNKDIRITSTPLGTVYYLGLNQKNPNLAKPEVREAFKWLVDYDAIGSTLIKNIGVIHQNFLPMGLLGASKEKPYKLDVAKAKALLAEAGHPDGVDLTLTTTTAEGLPEQLQSQLARSGFRVKIETIPAAQATQIMYIQHSRTLAVDQFAGRESPVQAFQVLFGEQGLMNPGRKADPAIAAAIAKVVATPLDSPDYPATLQAATALAVKAQPNVFISSTPRILARRKNVTPVGSYLMAQRFEGVRVS